MIPLTKKIFFMIRARRLSFSSLMSMSLFLWSFWTNFIVRTQWLPCLLLVLQSDCTAHINHNKTNNWGRFIKKTRRFSHQLAKQKLGELKDNSMKQEGTRGVNAEDRNRQFEFALIANYTKLIQLMLNNCIQCNLLRYISPINGEWGT